MITVRGPRLVGLLVLATLTSIVAAFWAIYGLQVLLDRRLTTLAQHWVKPPMINGVRLEISRYLPSEFRLSPDAKYIVFVTDDACASCRRQLPAWKTLLTELPLRPQDGVLVFSLKGAEIQNALRESVAARNASYFGINPIDARSFVIASGVRWTPTVVALDGEFRIRRVFWSMMPPVSDEFKEFFSAPDTFVTNYFGSR